MIKRSSIILFVTLVSISTISTEQARSQLLVPYTSQQEIEAATDVARDSLGSDVELIGIATTGEIDLSPVGLSGTVSGFDEENGESSVWGYQFASADGEEELGVVIIKFPFGSPFVRSEEGNLYNVQQQVLDLTGDFSGSNTFAAQLQKTKAFTDFRSDYPNIVSEAVVLAWNPDDADLFLPSGFPRTLPLWSIYFNTSTWGSGDSSLVCFTATGTGETVCYRSSGSSSVDAEETGMEKGLKMSLSTNIFVRGVTHEILVRLGVRTTPNLRLSLYSTTGERVLDLTDLVESQGTIYSVNTVTLALDDLPAGHYILHASDGTRSETQTLLVQ